MKGDGVARGMGTGSDSQREREKSLNLLKWVVLAGDLVAAALLVIVFSSIGTLIYAIAFALVVFGIFDFFVLFPWLIGHGQKKSM